MKLIFGLMLLKTAACVERFCWFNQGGPCYAALGDKLNLLMVVADASKYDLNIQKTISNTEKDPFCRVRNNTMKKNQCDLFNKRSEVSVINGILIINGVIRADSGTYRLYLDGSDGTETSTDLQVIVEGLEVNCWFNQSDPCYAALGHKLNLLMVDTSRYDLTIKKIMSSTQDDPVCKIKKGTIKKNECDLFNNRPEVSVIIGILIINGVIRADSGTYRLKLEGSDGRETSRDLQVIVEAPIGSVEVSIICCSSGVMRASCSSDGDPLLFSWTLNGDPLMDGNIIDLDEGTDGNISCSVKNHISHQQKTISVKHCPVSMVFVLVWCFQMMFLLGLLGGFHIYMRHTSGKKQEDQQVRMSRFREGHEHTAED